MHTTSLPKPSSARPPLAARLVAVALAAIAILALAVSPAAAAATGVVDVAAGNTLTVRSTPSTSGTQIGTLADGQSISLSCYTTGTSVTGTFGTTNRWDKLTSGGYVSQAYVSVTGTLADCNAPAPTGNALVDVAAGNTLTIRSTASTSGAAVGTYADNQRITVSCKTTGTSVTGTFGTTTTWYKVSAGYVSAAYVKADATPANCTTTTPPPSSTKAQTAINYGLAEMAKNNGYTGCNGGTYRMGGIAPAGGLNFNGSSCNQQNYYLPAGYAGWDCSGLMYKMYQAAGITIPTSSSTIASGVPTVNVGGDATKNLSLMKPGDMLVYGGHHVVMYIGTYNGTASVIEATNISRQSNGYSKAIQVRSVSSLLTNANYKVVRPTGI